MAIADQLNSLIKWKNKLCENLNAMGVAASTSEKLNTLVPKVLTIQTGAASSAPESLTPQTAAIPLTTGTLVSDDVLSGTGTEVTETEE